MCITSIIVIVIIFLPLQTGLVIFQSKLDSVLYVHELQYLEMADNLLVMSLCLGSR